MFKHLFIDKFSGRPSLIASIIIVFLFACSGGHTMQNQQSQQDSLISTVILSEVISVSPFSEMETAQRTRWLITLKVLQVIKGYPKVKQGDVITVNVHSVVKTFGDSVDTIRGKKLYIHYSDKFNVNYTGEITVVGASPRPMQK